MWRAKQPGASRRRCGAARLEAAANPEREVPQRERKQRGEDQEKEHGTGALVLCANYRRLTSPSCPGRL